MTYSNLKWHAEYRDYRRNVALYCFQSRGDSGVPVNFVATVDSEYKEGDVTEPSLTLRDYEAQQLIDELWNIGLRPSQVDSSPNHIAALNAHLQDLRKLVFHEKSSEEKNK